MTVEERLRDALEHKGSTVRVSDDAWFSIATGFERRRRTRPLIGGVAFVAVLALIVVTLAVVRGRVHSTPVVGTTGDSRTHARLVFLHTGPGKATADVFDADTGARRTVPLEGLVASAIGDHNALLVGDSIVILQANTVLALPATLDGPARTLGFANRVYRSATEGKVWLESTAASPDAIEMNVREIDTSGTDTASSRPLPQGFRVEAAVDDGLLGVMQPEPRPAAPWFAVWDPAIGTARRIEDGNYMIAAGGNTLVTASAPSMAYRGAPLRVVDITTDEARTVQPPREKTFFLGPGVLSPDGAVLLAFADTGGDKELVTIDVASGRATTVAGPALPHSSIGVGWSPDGQWFFFSVPGSHKRQDVFAYHRGAKTLAKLKATVGPFDAAVVVPAN